MAGCSDVSIIAVAAATAQNRMAAQRELRRRNSGRMARAPQAGSLAANQPNALCGIGEYRLNVFYNIKSTEEIRRYWQPELTIYANHDAFPHKFRRLATSKR